MGTRMQQRRGTAAEWAADNPILSEGEVGFELDTKIIKLGDGKTRWRDLQSPTVNRSGGSTIKASAPDVTGLHIEGARNQIEDIFTVSTDTDNVLRVAADGVLYSGNQKVLVQQFVDAAGDLIVGTGPDTVGRLPVGTSLQYLRVKQDLSGLEWVAVPAKKIVVPHTWHLGGDVRGASGDDAHIPTFTVPVPPTQRVRLSGWSGECRVSNFQAKLYRITPQGVSAELATLNIGGFSGTDLNFQFSHRDRLRLVVTAVNGPTKDGTVTVFLEYEV